MTAPKKKDKRIGMALKRATTKTPALAKLAGTKGMRPGMARNK